MRKSTGARQAAKGCNSAAATAAATATTKSKSDLGSIVKVKGASRRAAIAIVKAVAGQHHGQTCDSDSLSLALLRRKSFRCELVRQSKHQ
jgi:hypothetical protein